jgi:thymidylate synthase
MPQFPSHEDQFRRIFRDLHLHGEPCSPRGENIVEIENYHFYLSPYARFSNFEGRNLSIDYIKAEFLWYLTGDKTNMSICNFAKTWKEVANPDGTINSNYGQYMFGEQNQFGRVAETLKKDKDSRRASIVILSAEHLNSVTKDYPCTYSINFRIRQNYLNMSVSMRSQDTIFGLGADIPCFSFVHEMMYHVLKDTYPELQYGHYYHRADSFHAYEKHFEMLKGMATDSVFTQVECPEISGSGEVSYLLNMYENQQFDFIPDEYKFTKWLMTFETPKYQNALELIYSGKPVQLTI